MRAVSVTLGMPARRLVAVVRHLLLGLLLACGGACTDGTPAELDAGTGQPVTLTILTPADGTWTRERTISVTGLLAGAVGGEVRLGERTAPVVGGEFLLPAVPLVRGVNHLVVEHPATGAQAAATVLQDDTPPRITIQEPALGSFCPGVPCATTLAALVEDPAGLGEVSLQGEPADLLAGPPFVQPVSLLPGLQSLTVTATDTLGNQSATTRAVLSGTFFSPDEPLGTAVRLFLGETALATIGELVGQTVDGLDLGSLVQGYNPVFQNSRFTVVVNSLRHDPGCLLELSPGAGYLAVSLFLPRVEVQAGVSGDVQLTATGILEAATFEGKLRLRLAADGRSLVAHVDEPRLVLQGLQLYVVEGEDLLKLLGTYQQDVEDALARKLASLLSDVLPGLAADAFATLLEPWPLEVLGRSWSLQLVPETVDLLPTGIRLDVGGRLRLLDGGERPLLATSPGYYVTPGEDGLGLPFSGLMLSVKDDLLNLLLHEAWRTHVLEFTLDQAFLDRARLEIELVAGFLGSLLTELQPPVDPEALVELQLRASLPPVAELTADPAAPLQLDLGDLLVDVVLPGASPRTLVSLAVSVRAQASASYAKGLLVVTVGEAQLSLHAVGGEAYGAAQALFDPAAAVLLASLEPLLSSLIAPLPLPSPAGLAVERFDLTAAVVQDGYLSLRVSLVEQ